NNRMPSAPWTRRRGPATERASRSWCGRPCETREVHPRRATRHGDMKDWQWYLVRVAVGVVLTLIWGWSGMRFLGIHLRGNDIGGQLTAVAWFILNGGILFVIVGLPMLENLGDRIGGLFMPSDDSVELRPDFSIAEARVKQGRYEEAIAEFRKA